MCEQNVASVLHLQSLKEVLFCGGVFDQLYASMFSHFLKLSEHCSCKMQVSYPNSMFLLFAVFCDWLSSISGGEFHLYNLFLLLNIFRSILAYITPDTLQ